VVRLATSLALCPARHGRTLAARTVRKFWARLPKPQRRRRGRPGIAAELRRLIEQTAAANPLWRAPRIHGELKMLGTATRTVGQSGTGCGPAIWDSHNQRLYSMSYYNTLAGSQMVIQTWCFDLSGSSCPGGVHVPVWMNNDLGTFPVSSGIQNYIISYAPQCISCFDPGGVGGASNSGWIQFFVNGSLLAQVWGRNTADGGVFVNSGTTMHLYTLGGIY